MLRPGSDGNSFYQHLVAPTALSLLALPDASSPAFHILEIACGNGIFARRLCNVRPDVKVLATDFSSAMLEVAKGRTEGVAEDRMTFARLDATNAEQLEALANTSRRHGGFDKIVCK